MTPLEKIIRPIVEGQIRGFLKEHPKVVDAVDWFKPSMDKATVFTNSLAKRIVRDLTCASVRARLVAALLAYDSEAQPVSTVARFHCGEDDRTGRNAGSVVPPSQSVGPRMKITKIIEDERADEYKYVRNYAACEPWAAVGMTCHDCRVTWMGCWDNFQCPKCGKGELPWMDDGQLVTGN